MTRLWILVGLLAGCALEAAPEPASGTAEVVTLTAVRVGADGATQITRRSITAEQRDALIPAAKAAGGQPAPGTSSAHSVVLDDPCLLPSVFLYDAVNYGGDVLCISGTGTFALSDFVHHWKQVRDLFGTHWVPVGWQGLAGSAWASWFSADFYQDAQPEPVVSLGPQSGANFLTYLPEWDLFYSYPPDSVVIY